jgi:hypothetical protein
MCYVQITYISLMLRKATFTLLIVLFIASSAMATKIVHIEHYPNGSVKIEVIRVQHGLHQVNLYYQNGKLMETGFTKHGLREGRWMKYDEQGALIATAYFHQDLRIGQWSHMDPWTRSKTVVSYHSGIAQRYRTYNHEGFLIASGARLP